MIMSLLTRFISEFRGEVVGSVEALQHSRSSGGHVDADFGLVAIWVHQAGHGIVVV